MTNSFPLVQPSAALLCQIWYIPAQGEWIQVIDLPGNNLIADFFFFSLAARWAVADAASALDVWAGWVGADSCSLAVLRAPGSCCSWNLTWWFRCGSSQRCPSCSSTAARTWELMGLMESCFRQLAGLKINWFMSRVRLDYHYMLVFE